jgi:orotate phosphoribosyltransferase
VRLTLTPEYFDERLFESNPTLCDPCASTVSPDPDRLRITGRPGMGGVPLVTVVGQITGLPSAFVRKHAKTYGRCQLAEGVDVAGRHHVYI